MSLHDMKPARTAPAAALTGALGWFSIGVGALVAGAALGVAYARAAADGGARKAGPPRDYGERSGFPQPPETMRGAARGGFGAPRSAGGPGAGAAT